jgi:hypothetical protein
MMSVRQESVAVLQKTAPLSMVNVRKEYATPLMVNVSRIISIRALPATMDCSATVQTTATVKVYASTKALQ